MGKPIDWVRDTKRTEIGWNLWDWKAMKSLKTDGFVGEVLGCSVSTVRHARKKHGIAPWRSCKPRPEMRISHPDLEWEFVIPGVWDMEKMVARVPDDALALMMKCSTNRVTLRRRLAGVAPYPNTP